MQEQFKGIAPYLTHPLVLIGFALFLLFGFFQLLIKAGIIPTLDKGAGAVILKVILDYGFIIALTVCLLGFGSYAWVHHREDVVVKDRANRAESAFKSVWTEITDNIIRVTTIISALKEYPVDSFSKWNARRVNETELAFQERARNHYRDYNQHISKQISQFSFSNTTFKAHQNDLLSLVKPEINTSIQNAYKHLEWAFDYCGRFEEDIRHIISLEQSDTETYLYIQSHLSERILSVKSELYFVIGELCMLAETKEDMNILQQNQKLVNLDDVLLVKGEAGRKLCRQKAAELLQEKTDLLAARTAALASTSEQREVSRRVNDPYLLMLRKTMGLSEELSEADIFALQKKKLDENETDFAKLMTLASLSFLESDGEFAASYIERALKTEGITEIYTNYLMSSLDRLKNPEPYGESLGFMVMEIESEGHFYNAGFKLGDVLVGIDNKPLVEPTDISEALGRAKEYPFILNLLRNGSPMNIAVQPGKSAGIILNQLVCFHQLRL
ncbi:MAG: hypothetical protein D3910_02220 [Candidatus Electrothrix sp. ATG2]|nr:hypothetical protein [Candidatus Electrothrix sp. ATG2]